MTARIRPFLMFDGRAEEAMAFYVSLFADAEVVDMVRYGPGEAGRDGSIMQATFRIGGQTVTCTDSVVTHEFTFTPAFSFLVECGAEEEIDRLAAALLDGGQSLMPLDAYGFSRKFAWLSDRFGVSWQLNLA